MSFHRYPKYKDSGVAWLGEVPEHWAVKKIKHLAYSIQQGWSPQCEGFPAETATEWGVLKVGCVNGGIFEWHCRLRALYLRRRGGVEAERCMPGESERRKSLAREVLEFGTER